MWVSFQVGLDLECGYVCFRWVLTLSVGMCVSGGRDHPAVQLWADQDRHLHSFLHVPQHCAGESSRGR